MDSIQKMKQIKVMKRLYMFWNNFYTNFDGKKNVYSPSIRAFFREHPEKTPASPARPGAPTST